MAEPSLPPCHTLSHFSIPPLPPRRYVLFEQPLEYYDHSIFSSMVLMKNFVQGGSLGRYRVKIHLN